MTTQTLFENFEGFLQMLKEQSGKKRCLGVLTHPTAIIKNLKTAVSEEKFGCPRSR